jgi:hypothetical protein
VITQEDVINYAEKYGVSMEIVEEMILRGKLTYEDFALPGRPSARPRNMD